MFSSSYYPRERYLAALAEARAAEAEARAAEAEYRAAQAVRQQEEALQSRLYGMGRANQHHQIHHALNRGYCLPEYQSVYSAPACCAQPTALDFSAAPPTLGFYPPNSPACLRGHCQGPPRPPHHPFGHHRASPHNQATYPVPNHLSGRHCGCPPATSFAEQELQALLEQERLARFAVEEELRGKECELRAREREGPHPAVVGIRSPPHRPVPNHKFNGDDLSAFLKALGLTVAAAPGPYETEEAPFVCPSQAPEASKSTAQAPADQCTSRSHPEDFQKILESMFGIAAAQQSPKAEKAASIPRGKPAKPGRPQPNCESGFISHTEEIRNILSRMFGVPVEVNIAQQELPKAPLSKPTESKQTNVSRSPVEGSLLERLQARYQKEGESEGQDTVRAVVSNKPTPNHQPAAPTEFPPSQPNLLDRLRSRYEAEGEVEVRNTIQAVINSLTSNPARHMTNPSSPEISSTLKGKNKESETPLSPSDAVISQALDRVENIGAAFRTLDEDFVFPPQLDFIPASTSATSETTAFSRLAFTARNHPVRFYERTLTTLLNELDLIESYGNASLRNRRKEAVNLIEKALEALEFELAGRWAMKVENEQGKTVVSTSSALEDRQEVGEAPNVEPNDTISQQEVDLVKNPPLDGDSEVPSEETQVLTEPAEATDPLTAVEAEEPTTVLTSPTEESVPRESDQSLIQTPDLVPRVIDAGKLPELEDVPQVPTLAEKAEKGVDNTYAEAEVGADDKIGPNSAKIGQYDISSPTSCPDKGGNEESDTEDTFLLSQPKTPEEKPKTTRHKVSIEDLGSDWSDVEA